MLKSELSGDVLRISHQSPDVSNAFSLQDAKELTRILKTAKNAKVLVWTHPEGTPFCSGGNLKFYGQQKRRQDGILANRAIAQALASLEKSKLLTIAVVHGDCWGGGLELLACFDFVISEPHAFFGLWQRRIGLTFGWGGGGRLQRRVGKSRLLQMARLSESISAYEALRIGIIDEIITRAEIDQRIAMLLQSELKLPNASGMAFKDWTELRERAIFEKLWWNAEHLEVLKRFGLRKR